MAETSERDDVARLRVAWDAIVRGLPAPPQTNGNGRGHGLDPALTETVRRLHALDAAPGPSRALTELIWSGLMDGAADPSAANGVADRPTAAPNGRTAHVPPPPLPIGPPRRRSPVAELATAAIVLLSLALGVLGGRWMNGGTSGDEVVPAVGAPGTATFAAEVPAPEECRVAPRSRESVLALLGDPAGRTAVNDVYDPIASLPAGAPADDETVAAVTATIREMSACVNAGDVLRASALQTDRMLRLQSYPPTGPDAFAAGLATPSAPLPVSERSVMPVVGKVQLFGDGRVGAFLDGVDSVAWPGSGTPVLFVFAKSGDRYLVDDVIDVATTATPALASATATTASPGDGCRIAPRQPVEIRRLNEQAAKPNAQPFDRRPGPLPAGVPADAQTVAAVERTLREEVACARAGDAFRSAALRTDRFFVRFFATEGPLTDAELATIEAASADDDGLGWQLLPGSPILALPDGRVGALVRSDGAFGGTWAPEMGLMLLFARVGDRYLIDEEVTVTLDAMEAALTSSPAASPAAASAPTPRTAHVPASPTPTPRNVVMEVTATDPRSISPAPAPTVTPLPPDEQGAILVPTPPPAEDGDAFVDILAVTPGDVDLRAGPGDDEGLVATLSPQTLLEFTGLPVDIGGETWRPVRDMETGLSGWVREESVEPTVVLSEEAGSLTPATGVVEEVSEPVQPDDPRATVAALSTRVAVAEATATALAGDAEANALDPDAATERIEVDAEGVLLAEPGAEEAASAALRAALGRYEAAGCRLGFAFVTGYGEDRAEGIALARTVELLARRVFPDLLAGAAVETAAVPDAAARGRVELRLFFYRGCEPAAAPAPTAPPIEAPAPTGRPIGAGTEVPVVGETLPSPTARSVAAPAMPTPTPRSPSSAEPIRTATPVP